MRYRSTHSTRAPKNRNQFYERAVCRKQTGNEIYKIRNILLRLHLITTSNQIVADRVRFTTIRTLGHFPPVLYHPSKLPCPICSRTRALPCICYHAPPAITHRQDESGSQVPVRCAAAVTPHKLPRHSCNIAVRHIPPQPWLELRSGNRETLLSERK